MWEWEYFCPMIEVSIPSLEREMDMSGKERKLYRVEVLFNGRKHYVLRRHSDFQNLHRKLKKILMIPEFPSKRNPHLRTKPLDQRKQELEMYIQEILQQNEAVPQELLDFLQIRHFHSMNKADSTDCQLIQQCVVTFAKDPFFLDACQGLPDVVVDGVLQGLYPKDNRVIIGADSSCDRSAQEEPAPLPLIPSIT
ncbi:sorting nexin-22 isoform X2 [Sardina pilchardus]|uniref:sorting nexin-22 isoform X2 n=1 Tax=Sardina pilchardus TaxID=27697 RepID=UPI002E0EFFAD